MGAYFQGGLILCLRTSGLTIKAALNSLKHYNSPEQLTQVKRGGGGRCNVLTGATRPLRQFFNFSNASSVMTVPD